MALTKTQVDKFFIDEILPTLKDLVEQGTKDISARCQTYNNYIDGLFKDGEITEKQAKTFCIPKHLIR